MYPKSPPTYVPLEEDDWGCEVSGVRRWLGWCEEEKNEQDLPELDKKSGEEEETEQDLPELDKESGEEEDALTVDWGWCEGEMERDLNEVAGDSEEADASSYSSMPALESEGSPTCRLKEGEEEEWVEVN